MPDDTPDDLTLGMAQVLRDALDQGFLPPLYVAAVAVNGSAFVCRYNAPEDAPGLNATPLCDHISDPGYALPINIMVVDQTGRATHLVINPLARP